MGQERKITIVVGGDSRGGERALDAIDSRAGKVASSFRSAGATIAKAMGAVALGGVVALGAGLVSSFNAARESARVTAQTEQVIQTMGNAAGVTAEQVGRYSERLANLTGVDDEVIQQGANLVLTFGNIRNAAGAGNDIFDRTVALANDMSVALGQDMSASSIQLGKALNDPINGITALQRVGVSFTEAQRDQIKAMVEAGDMLGAQKVILGEVERQFGGTAAAVATPWDRLQVTLGNLQEKLGAHLIPIFDRVATWLFSVIPEALAFAGAAFDKVKLGISALVTAFQDGDVGAGGFVGVMQQIGAGARQVVDAVRPFVESIVEFFRNNPKVGFAALAAVIGGVLLAVLIAAGAAIVGLISPFVLVVAAVAALAAGVMFAWQRWELFRNIVTDIGEGLVGTWNVIRTVFEAGVVAVSALWDRFGATIMARLQGWIAGVITMWQGVWNVLSGIFELFRAIFTGNWSAAWDALQQILTGFGQILAGLWQQLWNIFLGLIQLGLGALRELWDLAWAGVAAALSAVWGLITAGVSGGVDAIVSFFAGLPQRLLDLVASVASAAGSIGSAIIDGLASGLGAAVGFVADIGKAIYNAVAGFVNSKIIDSINDALEFSVGPIDINAPDIPHLPRLHTGGIVPGRLGEEVLVLERAGERRLSTDPVSPLTDGRRGAGGGPLVGTMVVQSADPDRAGRSVVDELTWMWRVAG